MAREAEGGLFSSLRSGEGRRKWAKKCKIMHERPIFRGKCDLVVRVRHHRQVRVIIVEKNPLKNLILFFDGIYFFNDSSN